MPLREYQKKRDFDKTREPRGRKTLRQSKLRFVIHEHHASHLHFDLRLEMNGVLKSWAVPKGLSADPEVTRLAVQVEDHPFDYRSFEGVIPKGQYGGGEVYIFDSGYWKEKKVPGKGLRQGRLEFYLYGKKYRGLYLLVRSQKNPKNWFVKKVKDEYAVKDHRIFPKQGSERAPSFVVPQLAASVAQVPESGCIYEIKYDGYRIQTHLYGNRIKYYTRNGYDWTERFSKNFDKAFAALPTYSAVLDGEVVYLDKDGKSDFGLLQKALKENQPENLHFMAFDILYLHGQDLRGRPLLERKEILRELLRGLEHGLEHGRESSKLRFSDYLLDEGKAFWRASCQYGLEGIIAKKKTSLYKSERSSNWMKIKCGNNEEFVIIGYNLRQGNFASLHLARPQDEGFRYVGRVGSGFSQANTREVLKLLRPLKTVQPACEVPSTSDEIVFVKPRYYAQVRFQSWSANGRLLKAVYQGLREDKKVEDLTPSESIKVSHPEKVLFKRKRYTKKDLMDYYSSVGKFILPFVQDRPLSIVRCPAGVGSTCFFQKHFQAGESPKINLTKASDGKKKREYFSVNDVKGLLALVQLNTLEFHVMGSQLPDPSKPDVIVMDFDPGPEVKWADLKKVVLSFRDMLEQLGLETFIKSTGGKGVHVHLPIKPLYDWDIVKEVAYTLAAWLAEQWPDLLTLKMTKSLRKNKIFVDYLRNGRTATAIAPYSVRAREEAGVAIPISWEQFQKSRRLIRFDIREALKLLKSQKRDPWHGYFKATDQEIGFIGKS